MRPVRSPPMRKVCGIRRHLAALDPGNTLWQRDVLRRLRHDRRRQTQDKATRKARFHELRGKSWNLARKLTEADKTNNQWQRDFSVALDKIAYVKLALGDTAKARSRPTRRDWRLRALLADVDPVNNAVLRRDISIGLNKIGDVKAATGDLPGARAAYQGKRGHHAPSGRRTRSRQYRLAARPRFRLSTSSPMYSARWEMSRAQLSAGYEESLVISRKLATVDRSNVQWQTDLVVALLQARARGRRATRRRANCRRGAEDRRAARRRGQAFARQKELEETCC